MLDRSLCFYHEHSLNPEAFYITIKTHFLSARAQLAFLCVYVYTVYLASTS